MKNTTSWIIGIIFAISAMLFSGWVYMLVISIFKPISFKDAIAISLILNTIVLTFNHGRTLNDRD